MTGSSHNNATAQGVALPEGIELGKYHLIRKIGQGGFGITYLALHTESKEQVVVKENMPTFYAYRDKDTLLVHPLDEGEAKENYLHTLQRFVDEARTLARLHHPNIVRVLEAFEALGTAYYVMPLITGQELHKATPAVVDEAWLAPILRTLLGALDYLHAQNLLHRDLKPGNILLQEDGTPIIIDFGTARALQSNRSATMVGTPGYTPIEQITIHGNRGPWTDIYALGATCYRVITGELPPEANERLAADEDPYRPLAKRAELRHRFSAELLQSIDTALAVRAKNRWQSAKDWLQHLPTATPQPTAEPSTRSLPVTPLATEAATPRRGKLLTAIITIGLLLLLPFFYGAYAVYQAAEQDAKLRRAEEVRTEAVHLLQAEAERKAREEFELLTREAADRKAKEDAQAKLEALEITDYDKAILKYYNNPEKLKLLITAGADVNKADKDGDTPLYLAAREGHTECVKLLLDAPGIDVNMADKNGNTPLSMAARVDHTECVKLLLAAPGIDVNKVDEDGKTPLYEAADDGRLEAIKQLLAAPGIDLHKADKDGKTPLATAQEKGYVESARMIQAAINGEPIPRQMPRLSKQEAQKRLTAMKVDKKSYGDELVTAARWNYTEKLITLLAAGANVNHADYSDETPLCEAANYGQTEVIKLLLAAPGIDVNKADKNGETPLYRAAYYGRTECVKLLLAAPGIDVNKASRYGRTPLYQAGSMGHTEIVKLLKAAGAKK